MFKESYLRDQIVKQLDLIESGLTYIKKEYYISNELGTNAFIDILAKDKNNNLVIIEIKKSKSSERDAITELFKYIALLKRTKALKDSEIRLLIISTDWRELLVPFSEFALSTNYNSLGLKAIVTEHGKLLSFKKVELLEKKLDRKISRRHWLQLYEKEEERNKKSLEFSNSILSLDIKNFLILKFSYEDPYINEVAYGFYFAQQEEELLYYKNILKHNSLDTYNELCEYTKDMIAEDKLSEFADSMKNLVSVSADTLEIADPEKFNCYYGENKWTITDINRFGSFNNKFISDDIILLELCGYLGASFNWYANIGTNTNKALLNEIRNDYENCLYHNENWMHIIADILEYIQNKKNHCSFLISIYNPEDIFKSIASYLKNDNKGFLPKFLIIIDEDNKNELEIFEGDICIFKEKKINFNDFTLKFFDGDIFNYMLMMNDGAQKDINIEIMYELGLEYCCSYSKIVNDVKNIYYQSIRVKKEEIKEGHKQYTNTLKHFIDKNEELKEYTLELYKAHSNFFDTYNKS